MRHLCFIALFALAPLATADELTSGRQLRDLAVGERDDRLAAMIAKMKAQSNIHAVALEYDVLLWKDNELKSLPGGLENHVFEIGDKILFRVTSFADSYVYVFHRVQRPTGGPGFVLAQVSEDDSEPFVLNVKLRSK